MIFRALKTSGVFFSLGMDESQRVFRVYQKNGLGFVPDDLATEYWGKIQFMAQNGLIEIVIDTPQRVLTGPSTTLYETTTGGDYMAPYAPGTFAIIGAAVPPEYTDVVVPGDADSNAALIINGAGTPAEITTSLSFTKGPSSPDQHDIVYVSAPGVVDKADPANLETSYVIGYVTASLGANVLVSTTYAPVTGSGLNPGTPVFLDHANPGKVISTPPPMPNVIVKVGIATSSTEFLFLPEAPTA